LLDKSIRELDRERSSLLSQDKKLAAEIKKLARQGQLEAVKLMAKDLVRTRHSIAKLHVLKSQLQAVSLRMQTLKSTQTMADAMRGVTRAMKDMNSQLNVPRLNNIMQDFERQNGRMENTTDTLSDTIDNTMIADGEEEESEELVSQVLDELGCNIDVQLVDAPNSRDGVQVPKVAAPQAQTFEYVLEGADSTTDAHGNSIDDDLQTRLDNLRNT
jgi:charged multivesicular body protein 2A